MGVLMVVLLVGCGDAAETTTTLRPASTLATTTTSTTTTSTTSTTTTSTTSTTTVPAMTCQQYMTEIAAILIEASNDLGEAQSLFFGLADGTVADADGANQLLILADRVSSYLEDLEAIGEPPDGIEDVARLVRRGLESQEEAMLVSSRGTRDRNVAQIEQGGVLLMEGTAYFNEAADVVSEC